jgi:hypothetical protein
MAVGSENQVHEKDTESLLRATPVYPTNVYPAKDLDIDDLEYDQECSYRQLPGNS